MRRHSRKRPSDQPDREVALKALKALERQQRTLNHIDEPIGDSANDLTNAIQLGLSQ